MVLALRTVVSLAMVLWALAPALAQDGADAAEKIAVVTKAGQGETLDYGVVVTVKGSMPVAGSAEPVELDVVYDLVIRHRYGRADRDGLVPLEISVIGSKATVGGQELAVAPGTFPRISVLFDPDWRMTEVYGLANYPRTVPGINYGNLVILFVLHGGGVPRAVGEKWVTDVAFPAYDETYRFTSAIKSVDRANGAETVRVAQSIDWVNPKPAGDIAAIARATAESVFAADGGRLLRSSAMCEVTFGGADGSPPRQEIAAHRANIAISISPAPAAVRP